MFKISYQLMDAYKGLYEDEIVREFASSTASMASLQQFATHWAEHKIISDSPAKRLQVYLEWNGIIGYASTAYYIATGGL